MTSPDASTTASGYQVNDKALMRNHCWETSQAQGTTKLVELSLIEFFNLEKGYAWPSQQKIAERCGLARQTVSDALSHLVTAGQWHVEIVTVRNGVESRYRPTGVMSSAKFPTTTRGAALAREAGRFVKAGGSPEEPTTGGLSKEPTGGCPETGQGVVQSSGGGSPEVQAQTGREKEGKRNPKRKEPGAAPAEGYAQVSDDSSTGGSADEKNGGIDPVIRALCSDLADVVASNNVNGKRPNITDSWLKGMTILVADGNTPEQIRLVTAYLVSPNAFWADKVTSPTYMRTKWTQIVKSARTWLQASRQTEAAASLPGSTGPAVATGRRMAQHTPNSSAA